MFFFCSLNPIRIFWQILTVLQIWKHREWLYCLFLSGLFTNAVAQYEAFPPGFGQVLVTNGLSYPTAVAFAPDGRIFVAEQGGKLRVIKDNVLLPTPFAELYVYAGGEAGLGGVVLDPNFTFATTSRYRLTMWLTPNTFITTFRFC